MSRDVIDQLGAYGEDFQASLGSLQPEEVTEAVSSLGLADRTPRRGWLVALAAAIVVMLVVAPVWLLGGGTDPVASDPQTSTVPPPEVTEVPPATMSTSTTVSSTPASPVFSLEALSLGEQQAFSFVSSDGVEIDYLLYVPGSYDANSAWPVVLFLHSYLGRDATLGGGNPLAWFDSGAEFPFVLVAPMGPRGLWSDYHGPMEELFVSLGGSLSIDQEAVFLTGASAGAVGTWQWALAKPGRFAGIAPVSGGPSMSTSDPVPGDICRLVDLPIWVAHSEADPLSIDLHAATVAALEACGSTSVRFTVYQDLGHDESIRTAYAGPDLYQWIIEQVP